MVGFEIARLSLEESLQRIESLKDIAVLPLDEAGEVVADDSGAHEAAREIRLLLQRVLDLDASAFLAKMRELYFHLFSVDHEHYRDLMFQAAQKDPVTARDFCVDFFFSDSVLFIDDQENLHDLLDVLEFLGLGFLPEDVRDRFRSLWAEPFFRLPSLLARVVKFLSPVFRPEDILVVRRLFEMDLIPAEELTWDVVRPAFETAGVTGSLLHAPHAAPGDHLDRVTIDDFEDIRWGVGLEGTMRIMTFRLLGSMVAAGSEALIRFITSSEEQPDTAFTRDNFETTGHRLYFLKALDLLREEILRDVHRSSNWFLDVPEEKLWPWFPAPHADPWPLSLRTLPAHWGEFADPTDGSPFAENACDAIERIDALVEKVALLLTKHSLPSTRALQEGEDLLAEFLREWNELFPEIRGELAVIP